MNNNNKADDVMQEQVDRPTRTLGGRRRLALVPLVPAAVALAVIGIGACSNGGNPADLQANGDGSRAMATSRPIVTSRPSGTDAPRVTPSTSSAPSTTEAPDPTTTMTPVVPPTTSRRAPSTVAVVPAPPAPTTPPPTEAPTPEPEPVPPPPPALTTGTVDVTGYSGRPENGIFVYEMPGHRNLQTFAITAAPGNFRVAIDLPPGRYKVGFYHSDFVVCEKEIDVVIGATATTTDCVLRDMRHSGGL